MVFNVYQPPEHLRRFVKGYLEADSRGTTVQTSHKLFPNGYSGIFFNFGNLGKLSIKQEFETPRVSIFGQIDRSFDAVHWPGSYSLGVLLEPVVLSRFLRTSMSEFTNKAFDGISIRSDLYSLHEELIATPLVSNKIGILNRFFTSAFNSLQSQNLFVDHALLAMTKHNSLSVSDLAKKLKVSDRYLEAQFKAGIGVSPKTYLMILRFKRIEGLLQSNPRVRWGEVNFSDEYYDQNHFIKDFKRFTGHTPTDYLAGDFEMGRSYLLG